MPAALPSKYFGLTQTQKEPERDSLTNLWFPLSHQDNRRLEYFFVFGERGQSRGVQVIEESGQKESQGT